jgi:nucleotide-binding universal stress UspA family protein
MTDVRSSASVVVGIDGSRAAAHAAVWAADEAVARDVPLRLVHVARPDSLEPPTDVVPLGIEYGETVLRQANAAISAAGKVLKIDTAIVKGDPTAALLAESEAAELICVGSSGIDALAERLLGSKALELAEQAHCPVAIIRDHAEKDGPERRWIAVAVTASTDAEEVMIAALEQARLHDAPLLAIGLWQRDFGDTPHDELDSMIESWRQRYPDVHVHLVTTRASLAQFLNDEDEAIELVVIDAGQASHVSEIIGPHRHPIFAHLESSVLIVRH